MSFAAKFDIEFQIGTKVTLSYTEHHPLRCFFLFRVNRFPASRRSLKRFDRELSFMSCQLLSLLQSDKDFQSRRLQLDLRHVQYFCIGLVITNVLKVCRWQMYSQAMHPPHKLILYMQSMRARVDFQQRFCSKKSLLAQS